MQESAKKVEQTSSTQDIHYQGDGWDYFKLTFVNIIFTILTLGIYSPWAKVKKTKYLCNSLSYKDSTFDFHAKPIKILISRIIILLTLGLVAVFTTYFMPSLSFIVPVLIYVLTPLLILKSIQFKINNTSFRNIRFHFKLDIKKVYVSILKTPIFLYSLVSTIFFGTIAFYSQGGDDQLQAVRENIIATIMGIFFIIGAFVTLWTLFKISKYTTAWFNTIYDNIYYGGVKLNSNLNQQIVAKEIVHPYIKGFSIILGTFITVGLGSILFPPLMFLMFPLTGIFGIYGIYLNFKLQHSIMNTIWNNASFEGHKFQNNLRLGSFIEAIVANLILISFTAGLYTPFAIIKMQQLLWSNRSLNIENLDHVIAHAQETESNLIEELSDTFDFDFDIAL